MKTSPVNAFAGPAPLTKEIADEPYHRDSASWRDPAGCVFSFGGKIFRQVNRSFAREYGLLHTTGLYEELLADGLMIPHEEVAEPIFDTSQAHRILYPEQLPFISYPYEWSFAQLQDAALATLRMQQKALKHGMTLRDASAFNVQPRRGTWALIDTLSFEQYKPGQPWIAYRQFCQHFLAPLALMAKVDPALCGLFRNQLDGIDLNLAAKLLPWRTQLGLGLGLHVHAHARFLRRFASAGQASQARGGQLSNRQLKRMLEHLESTVAGLKMRRSRSTWSEYYDSMLNYSEAAFSAKHAIITDMLRELAPTTVWDLGANNGAFSRIAAEQGAHTIAWDLDHNCVQAAYEAGKQSGEQRILPLLLDLTNPSPDLGWAHQERHSLARRAARAKVDVVMMLGLIHHLSIGANVPLGHISRYAASLGETLIVEFVPKEDSQVRRLLSAREDVFAEYTRAGFEAAFKTDFMISGFVQIPETERSLYILKRK
ncbi:MAG: hypothetical protein MPJ50_01280 [Pirellulales bacterium]|nr:hypothetical protein [Pirellulales bacterium]